MGEEGIERGCLEPDQDISDDFIPIYRALLPLYTYLLPIYL